MLRRAAAIVVALALAPSGVVPGAEPAAVPGAAPGGVPGGAPATSVAWPNGATRPTAVRAVGPTTVRAAGPIADPAAEAPAYRPPVPGGLTRRFDPPDVPWGSGHRGVDLAAEVGDVVGSPGPGVVTFAGTVAGRGVVTVRHPDGLRSSLEPVAVVVREGDPVEAGSPLGTLEGGGSHLGVHWGVRDGAAYVDPLGLLPRAGPVVLLPL